MEDQACITSSVTRACSCSTVRITSSVTRACSCEQAVQYVLPRQSPGHVAASKQYSTYYLVISYHGMQLRAVQYVLPRHQLPWHAAASSTVRITSSVTRACSCVEDQACCVLAPSLTSETQLSQYHNTLCTVFVQKSDCGFPGQNYFFFQTFRGTLFIFM